MKKWAVFSDVDGTVYGFPEKKLSETNKKKILELKSKNIPFILNTGNGPFEKIKNLADVLETRYIVCAAGAVIYDNLEKKYIHVEFIDQDYAKEFFELANKHKISIYYFGIDQYYLHNFDQEMYDFLTEFNEYSDWVTTGEINRDLHKIEVYGDFEEVQRAYNVLRDAKIDEKLNVMYMGSHIEIVKKGVDKGTGIKWMSENILGVKLEDTMAIGDSPNDIGMLKVVGYSYAMDNADAVTKKVAKYYTSDVYQAGLAEAIDDYLYRTDFENKKTISQAKSKNKK